MNELENRPLNILVRPCYPFFLKNKLFVREHDQAAHWMDPLVQLKASAEQRGWQMNTWDMQPLESADVILMQDLPRREEFDAARAKAKNAKFILLIWETPLSRPLAWQRKNQDYFDGIITYDGKLADGKRYFHYYLPPGDQPESISQPAFQDRRPLIMMNSNRWIGLLANREPGLTGLPHIGPMFSGWHLSLSALLNQDRGEQYSHRRNLARLADREFPHVLDAYGPGWKGEPMSWAHRIIRHRPFACGRGKFNGDKLALMSGYRFAITFENVLTDCGYISEKIFDVLYAGAVPIYLGDARIGDLVPPECYVDARQFNGDDSALLRFARDCPPEQWEKLHTAGREFLASPRSKKATGPAFVGAVMNAIDHVINPM